MKKKKIMLFMLSTIQSREAVISYITLRAKNLENILYSPKHNYARF